MSIIVLPVPAGIESGMILYCGFFLLLITWVVLFKKDIKDSLEINFSWIDSIIFLLILYMLVRNSVSIKSFDWDFVMKISCCMGIYYLTKLSKKMVIIEIGLIINGIIQSIIVILQVLYMFPSNHEILLPTGTFENPSISGLFIACCIPFVLNFIFNFKDLKKYNIELLLWLILILMLMAVAASGSRTSWIFVILTSGMLIYDNKKKSWNEFCKCYKFFIIIFTIIIIVAFGLFLYVVKPVSANSRLYIWYITVETFLENAIFGVGKSFSYYYMNNQAEYLNANPDSPFQNMADNIHHCYNEFLQFLVQYGIIGIILMVLIIFLILKNNYYYRYNVYRISILGLLIASLFSYSLSTVPILFVLSFLLGSISKSFKKIEIQSHLCDSFVIRNSHRGFILYCSIFIFFNFIFFCYANSIYFWSKGVNAYRQKCYEQAEEYFSECGLLMNSNGFYLNMRGKGLSLIKKYNESNELMNKAILIRYSTFSEIVIGENNIGIGDYNNAEKAFNHAYCMIPSRMLPLYLLAIYQYELDDVKRFRQTSARILSIPLKVNSTANKQMIENITRLLNDM